MEKVFQTSELLGVIFEFLDPTTIRTVRLVSRVFQNHCDRHFALTLTIEEDDDDRHLLQLVEVFKANRLYLIQTLRVGKYSRQRDSRSEGPFEIKKLVPEGLGYILNQIPPVRHVHITETVSVGQEWYDRGWVDRSAIPAQLTWSATSFWEAKKPDEEEEAAVIIRIGTRAKVPVRNRGTISGWIRDRLRAGFKQNTAPPPLAKLERPLSRMEQLPLEAPLLLSRLETLTIRLGTYSPRNLDPFFIRLSQSSAADTLRSLTVGMAPRPSATRNISWEVLRPCVLVLRALQTLDLEGIKVCRGSPDGPGKDAFSSYSGKTSQVALVGLKPTVQKLRFNCRVDPGMKLTILAFFSNVQFLEMSALRNLWDREVDQALDAFDTLGGSTVGGQVVPLPLLKTLQVPILTAANWTEPKLLRLWVQQRPLQLDYIQFPVLPTEPFTLATALSKDLVTIRRAWILPQDRNSCIKLLASPCFHAVEELEISNRYLEEWKVNGMEIITRALLDKWEAQHPNSFPRPLPQTSLLRFSEREEVEAVRIMAIRGQLTRAILIESLPWTATLTKLHLGHHRQFYSFYRNARSTSVWMGRILQLMPHLEDFALFKALPDLELFEGIGRRRSPLPPPPLSSFSSNLDGAGQEDRDDQNSGATLQEAVVIANKKKNAEPLYEDWSGERPFLTRLAIHQANTVDDDNLVSWKEILEHKFRFLEALSLTRESEEDNDDDR